MKNSEIIKSDEVINLMGSLGLRLGEDPENLRYGQITGLNPHKKNYQAGSVQIRGENRTGLQLFSWFTLFRLL